VAESQQDVGNVWRGQWPVQEHRPFFLGARPGGSSPGGATRSAMAAWAPSRFAYIGLDGGDAVDARIREDRRQNAAASSVLSVYQRWGDNLVIVSSFTLQL